MSTDNYKSESRPLYRVIGLGTFGEIVTSNLLNSGISADRLLCVTRQCGLVAQGIKTVTPSLPVQTQVPGREFLWEMFPDLGEAPEFEFVVGAFWEGFALQWLPSLLVPWHSSESFTVGIAALPCAFHGSLRRVRASQLASDLKAQGKFLLRLNVEPWLNSEGVDQSLPQLERRCASIVAQTLSSLIGLLEFSPDGPDSLRWFWQNLGQSGAEVMFASASIETNEPVPKLLDGLLSNPSFDVAKELQNATAVLVVLGSSEELPLSKVNTLVDELARRCKRDALDVHYLFDARQSGRISVSLFLHRASHALNETMTTGISEEKQDGSQLSVATPMLPMIGTLPVLNSDGKKEPVRSAKPKQEEFILDVLSSSRFAKTEPTYYKGENLDVPAYLRRGLRL